MKIISKLCALFLLLFPIKNIGVDLAWSLTITNVNLGPYIEVIQANDEIGRSVWTFSDGKRGQILWLEENGKVLLNTTNLPESSFLLPWFTTSNSATIFSRSGKEPNIRNGVIELYKTEGSVVQTVTEVEGRIPMSNVQNWKTSFFSFDVDNTNSMITLRKYNFGTSLTASLHSNSFNVSWHPKPNLLLRLQSSSNLQEWADIDSNIVSEANLKTYKDSVDQKKYFRLQAP